MKKKCLLFVVLSFAMMFAGCEEDESNPCKELIPYWEIAQDEVCPDFAGCSYCEPVVNDFENEPCDGQARKEAENLLSMEDPQATLNYSFEVGCQLELQASTQ